jgi:hypothetical protein
MNKLLIIILGACTILSCREKKSIFYVKDKTVQLDTVTTETSKEGSFYIYNKGEERLLLEKYTTSCECTILELENNKTILPNDSLLVKFEIKGYSDDKGKQKNTLCTFKTNSNKIFEFVNLSYYTK